MTRRESIELGQRKRERHVGEERLGRRGGRLRGEGRLCALSINYELYNHTTIKPFKGDELMLSPF